MIKLVLFCLIANSLLLSNCKEQITNGSKKGEHENDTISLLTKKDSGFWDIQRTEKPFYNHTGECISWLFTSDKKLIEYSYVNGKRIRHIYGGDIILGDIDFDIKSDTIQIQELNEKYVIRRLTKDTLEVQHIGLYGVKPPIIFVNSPVQGGISD